MKSPPRPRCAFSLIELLSAIAVVAILAAILIPVVSGVRRNSLQAGCASNLRQIHLSLALYLNDNNGLLPGPTFMAQGPFYYRSQTATANSLAARLSDYMGPPNSAPQRGVNIYAQPLLACPAWESAGGARTPSPTGTAPASYILNLTPWPFGLIPGGSGNIRPFGDANQPAQSEAGKPRGIRDIIDFPLSRTWMLTDADNRFLAEVMNWPGSANYPASASHGSFRNVLFYDGHVARVPLEEFKRYP